jgi:hypothetical protein
MGQFNVDLKRVQLAFQVGLKTDLDLPLSVHSMRHISASCVNQMDLDAAKKRILDGELIGLHRAENTYNESILALKSAKSGPIKPLPNLQDFKVQSLAYTLSRYRPWRKHVERAHPSEGQALQDLAHHYLQTALKAPLSENALRNGTESAEFLFSHGLAFAKALEAIRKIQERPGRLR